MRKTTSHCNLVLFFLSLGVQRWIHPFASKSGYCIPQQIAVQRSSLSHRLARSGSGFLWEHCTYSGLQFETVLYVFCLVQDWIFIYCMRLAYWINFFFLIFLQFLLSYNQTNSFFLIIRPILSILFLEYERNTKELFYIIFILYFK